MIKIVNEYRIIVAGSRSFNDYDQLKKVLDDYLADKDLKDIIIVLGGAIGADSLGMLYARDHNLDYKLFIPEWNKYGKKAGIIRNGKMAEYAAETDSHLFVFWDGVSRGTKNMVQQAKKHNIETTITYF